MRRLLLAATGVLLLTGLVLPAGSVAPASAATAGKCTARNGQICTYGRWDIFNNTWGTSPGTYVITATSAHRWTLTANQNGGGGCNGCAVEAYESAQWNYKNVPYSRIREMTSTFSETMPKGSLKKNHFDAEAAYDVFLNGSDTDEVMVWVDNQGQTPAGSFDKVARINGQRFRVYVSGQTKSFVRTRNETKGTVNYKGVLTWLHDHGMLKSSDTMWQFNFGWEVCDTGGVTKTFTVHNLTLKQKV
jgi:hypothetical protein